MSPAETHFTAREMPLRDDCRGCLFEPEHSRVCRLAVVIAQSRGLPDCEYPTASGKRVIYVLDASDARQVTIFEAGLAVLAIG